MHMSLCICLPQTTYLFRNHSLFAVTRVTGHKSKFLTSLDPNASLWNSTSRTKNTFAVELNLTHYPILWKS